MYNYSTVVRIFGQLFDLTSYVCKNGVMIRVILSVIAGVLALSAYVPYLWDIVAGRAKPARSTRITLVIILLIAFFQLRVVGATFTLAIVVGELLGSIAVLAASFKRGVGGLTQVDMICYGLLLIDIIVWLTTGNAAVALFLSIAADVISFYPTLHKTWLHPTTETPLFYHLGNVAVILNLVAATHLTWTVAIYPLILIGINSVEVLLIYRLRLNKILLHRSEANGAIIEP